MSHWSRFARPFRSHCLRVGMYTSPSHNLQSLFVGLSAKGLLFRFIFIYVYVCMACMCGWYLWRPEGRVGSPGAEAT